MSFRGKYMSITITLVPINNNHYPSSIRSQCYSQLPCLFLYFWNRSLFCKIVQTVSNRCCIKASCGGDRCCLWCHLLRVNRHCLTVVKHFGIFAVRLHAGCIVAAPFIVSYRWCIVDSLTGLGWAGKQRRP